MTDYRPGLAAAAVDRALRDAVRTYDRARRNVTLWFTDALERGLYRDLGYASMEIYARQGLGFSPGRTRQFLALSRSLRRMPVLRGAVTDGRLGWTKAQEVARMVTPATEEAWVEKAVELPREELRKEMAAARGRARERRQAAAAGQLALGAVPEPSADAAPIPAALGGSAGPAADPPTTIAVQFDGLQLARFDALVAAAKKSSRVAADASRAEVILAGLAALTENPEGVRRHAPAATVVVERCPDCAAAFALTSNGKRRLDRAQAAAIGCDHVARDERGHQQSAIPPAVRRQVLDRDGHGCTAAGCDHTQFLEVHHVVPRVRGGSNRAENLVTLCSRCHRFVHELEP